MALYKTPFLGLQFRTGQMETQPPNHDIVITIFLNEHERMSYTFAVFTLKPAQEDILEP